MVVVVANSRVFEAGEISTSEETEREEEKETAETA